MVRGSASQPHDCSSTPGSPCLLLSRWTGVPASSDSTMAHQHDRAEPSPSCPSPLSNSSRGNGSGARSPFFQSFHPQDAWSMGQLQHGGQDQSQSLSHAPSPSLAGVRHAARTDASRRDESWDTFLAASRPVGSGAQRGVSQGVEEIRYECLHVEAGRVMLFLISQKGPPRWADGLSSHPDRWDLDRFAKERPPRRAES